MDPKPATSRGLFFMSTKKSTQSTTAKFGITPANQSTSALCTAIDHQVGAIEQCADYKNQPTVQAATTLLATDNTGLTGTVAQIANLRAQLIALEATRDQQVTKVMHDRRNAEAAITVVCGGNIEQIKAYGCTPSARTLLSPSTLAPEGLTAKPSQQTAGTLTVKVRAVAGATTYLFQVATDPTTAAGAGTPIISPKASVVLTGQPVGHTLYLRAAVVRRSGGQSAWTDVVQVTVR